MFIIRPLLTLTILLLSFSLFAQNADEGILVTGTLVDQTSEQPLEFATVIAYDSKDSTMTANSLTDIDGSFQLKLPPGNYYLSCQYVGYQDGLVTDVEVTGGLESIGLGEIYMQGDAVVLEEVEIRAERSSMELKLDKRVFNVGKDLTNAGNTAADILDNVPSVTVDAEGNVNLRGSEGVRILVNGKPSSLLAAGDLDALQRMQGDIIQSVEVITNPSARYEAEGEAGIINIILRKEKARGVNGSFGLTAGHPHRYSASYSLNYRQDDLNFFSNFGISYRKSPGGGESTQRWFDDGQLERYFTTDNNRMRESYGGNMQLGADWYIDQYNQLTGSVLYRLRQSNSDSEIIYEDLDAADNLVNRVVRTNDESEPSHNFEAELNYTRTFEEKDREWTASVKYILDDDTEMADYLETSTFDNSEIIQRSNNTEDEINFLAQTDYIHPFNDKTRMEGGLRAAIRTVNNNYLVEQEDESGIFRPLPSFDDNLQYIENIYAAYLIGATEYKKFGFQMGLRAEYSDVSAELLESNQINEQNYLNLFPNASLTYKLSEKNQLQASYSRRISRPWFRLLLPFSNLNDSRYIWRGNPNLVPEFTDSYEIGYLNYFSKGSFLTSVYYRHTTGVIERLVFVRDSITERFPVNLGTRDSYGMEFNLSYDITKWWDVTTDVNVYYSSLVGTYEEGDIVTDVSVDIFAWNGEINSRWKIGKDVDFQASFDYNAPRNTAQGRRLAYYSLDVALSIDLFNKKGTLTIGGRDLFNTRVRRWEVDTPELISESSFQWRQTRRVNVSFNYRLNQDKRSARRGGRRGGGRPGGMNK